MVKLKILFGLFLAVILTFTGCSATPADKNPDNSKTQRQESTGSQKPSEETSQQPEKTTDPVEEQLKSMTLEEKIGQMFIVGFDGYEIDDNVRRMINDYHVGGFILFSRNIESPSQLAAIVNSLKSANLQNKAPLFVSVDEEGGKVTRMPAGLEKLPTAQAVGRVNNGEFSYKLGNVIAEEIKSFGFNVDFAPVLDINSNPKNPVIGDRSFGANAEIVGKLGVQTMKGLQDGGVMPVVKHFPGHGDTSVDSHIGLPYIDHGMERLESFELVPFKEAVNHQADAVMIAHILLRKIDPEYPASLSKTIVTDLLRNQMGFKGVVITDDLTMGAISDSYSMGGAAVKAVNAGNDIVLVCHGYDNETAAMDALRKAVENGTISEERIDESVTRILKLKRKYNLTDNMVGSVDVDKINTMIRTTLDSYMNSK